MLVLSDKNEWTLFYGMARGFVIRAQREHSPFSRAIRREKNTIWSVFVNQLDKPNKQQFVSGDDHEIEWKLKIFLVTQRAACGLEKN